MTNSRKLYNNNITSIESLDTIYTFLDTRVKVLDLSEIVRAQYVLLVSAFDYYIHDLVREGMLAIYSGEKLGNKEYEKFSISMQTLAILLATSDENIRKQIIDNEVRKTTSKFSFQAPNNVENALSLISVKSIWSFVSKELARPKDEIVKTLGLIINRRNKIAHEADIDPVTNEKTPLERSTLIEVKKFFSHIVIAIDKKILADAS